MIEVPSVLRLRRGRIAPACELCTLRKTSRPHPHGKIVIERKRRARGPGEGPRAVHVDRRRAGGPLSQPEWRAYKRRNVQMQIVRCAGGMGVGGPGREFCSPMKITVNVDCTPLEARQFMGLPDVEPMQKAAMAEVEKRMMVELERFSPESLFKAWLPIAGMNAEWLQEFLKRATS